MDSERSNDRNDTPWFFEFSSKEVRKGIEGLTEFLILTNWAFEESKELFEEKYFFQEAKEDKGIFLKN